MNLKKLIGSGHKIGQFVLPFIILGLALNILFPTLFSVGGPSPILKSASLIVLTLGIITWLWSVVLILYYVPKNLLITSGPYSVVKHPLYTGVSLLVLPWLGFLLNSWLGVVAGILVYIASRRFSPEEERELSRRFGSEWTKYCRSVALPRL